MKRKFKSLDDEKSIDIQNYLINEWDDENVEYETSQNTPEGYMLKAAIDAVAKMESSHSSAKHDSEENSDTQSAPKLLPAEAIGTTVTKISYHPESESHEEEEGDGDSDSNSAPEQEEEKLRISPVPMPAHLKKKTKSHSKNHKSKSHAVRQERSKKKVHDVKKRYEKFLTNVPGENAFVLKSGNALMNMRDLSSALLTMPVDVYDHHVNQERNDFYNWVSSVIGDKAAANSIQKSKTRYEMAQRISARIQFLERKCR